MRESSLLLLAPILISSHLTIQPVVPLEANQGWALELFEVSQPIAPHYHKFDPSDLYCVEEE